MGRLDTVLGGFGVLATLFGVGLWLAPDTVRVGPVADLAGEVAATGATQLLLALGIVTGLLVSAAAWPRSTGDRSLDGTGQPTAGGQPDLLGADIERAIRDGGEAWRGVRSTLAETATTAYARRAGVPPAAAERAVREGRWTSDDLAAGVLASNLPYSARLRLWLVPERERQRRVERTVAAIERLGRR